MVRLIVIAALVFSALVGGEGLFFVDQAYAFCCMCGTCKFGCSCPGLNGCPYCDAPNIKISQDNNAGSTETLNVRRMREPEPSAVITSGAGERLVQLVQAQCVRSRFKLIGQDEIIPRFESAYLKDSVSKEKMVAFQITANER